jgi:hypothetical protein
MLPVAARFQPSLAIGVRGRDGIICHTAIYWGFNQIGQEWVIDCTLRNGVQFRQFSDFCDGRECFLMNYAPRPKSIRIGASVHE